MREGSAESQSPRVTPGRQQLLSHLSGDKSKELPVPCRQPIPCPSWLESHSCSPPGLSFRDRHTPDRPLPPPARTVSMSLTCSRHGTPGMPGSGGGWSERQGEGPGPSLSFALGTRGLRSSAQPVGITRGGVWYIQATAGRVSEALPSLTLPSPTGFHTPASAASLLPAHVCLGALALMSSLLGALLPVCLQGLSPLYLGLCSVVSSSEMPSPTVLRWHRCPSAHLSSWHSPLPDT